MDSTFRGAIEQLNELTLPKPLGLLREVRLNIGNVWLVVPGNGVELMLMLKVAPFSKSRKLVPVPLVVLTKIPDESKCMAV